ncbi:hypothetical protein BCD91_001460 [Clostridium beijerinckii]|uniref:hypothetical protein n=1 Tax=Clostridium beijerinckii TaxID=1520 RepID=UPI001494004C|nr:hypothetical protein [Clostridium beijerinckii]NOW89437.1 hypothetical protein [Clostridium beijerinckii]
MNLEELFQKYREISLNIIKTLEDDHVEELNSKFEERKNILDGIINLNENKENLRILYEKYDLFKIDGEMELKIKSSMNDVRNEMIKIKKRKEANKSYNNINARSVYLSKKI